MTRAFCIALALVAVGSSVALAQDETDAPAEERAAPEGDEPTEDVVDSLGQAVHDLGESMRADGPDRSRIRWSPSWPRYRFDELVLTLGMGLVIALAELLPTRSEPNWSGVTIFDTATQDALGLDDPEQRHGVEIASDVLVSLLVIWPVAVDSLLYTGLGEGAWDVAWQLSLISLEVFAINHALNITLKLLSRRERPINTYCRDQPGYDADPVCADPPPAESFWSGHVSNAFAGAALVCLHHDVLDLFGDVGADGAMCGGALATAAATGLFRIMSDRHWITDVLMGAAVGSLIGTLVPWLLHYQGGGRPPLRGTAPPVMVLLAPMADEDTIGLSASGIW